MTLLAKPLITRPEWHPSYPLNFPQPKEKWRKMEEMGNIGENGAIKEKDRGIGGGRW